VLGVYLSSFIVIFGGGFSWFFVKLHSQYQVPVEYSIFYRQFFASLFLFFIAFLQKKKLKLTLHQIKLCLLVALLYYTVYFLGAYYASIYLAAGLVAFISATKVIFVEIILSIKEKRNVSGRVILSGLFGVSGIILMSKSNMSIEHLNYKTISIGLTLAFVAPIANALSNVAIQVSRRKKTIDNFVMVAYCSLIGSIFVLLFGFLNRGLDSFVFIPLKLDYIVGLSYLSFVSSGISIVCVYYLIEKIGSVKTTFMSLGHPPFAMLLSVIFGKYKIDTITILGMILSLYGLYIGLRYQQKRKKYIELSQRKKIFKRNLRETKRKFKKSIAEWKKQYQE
jgi:drug/metabolite transporter (DMT)-like permease